MADMAQAIGRDADAARYTTLHGKIVAAAQKELLKPNGIAGNASQTSQVLALHCGLTPPDQRAAAAEVRSEEHTSELQSLMRISYAVFCLKKKNSKNQYNKKTNN